MRRTFPRRARARPAPHARLLLWALSGLWMVAGCAALSDELQTAAVLYDDAHYEAAERWLETLESQRGEMSRGRQAQFYYLRGMTAYRLGQRSDALHYLALASVASGSARGALRPERRVILERTLAELTPLDASHHPRHPS